MIKFYNGRKLVKTVVTSQYALVINQMIQSEIVWTRYKIIH